jgi:hypothetical protein
MIRQLVLISFALAMPLVGFTDQPTVQIKPPQLQGSRAIEKQTETAVFRDYLQSWKTLQSALDKNQSALLDQSFVGTARDKLANTIDEQLKLGIHTHYQDRSHELQIVFYSPEGLSIQIIDTVEYEQQVFDHDKIMVTKPIRNRYLIVLTPTETRWKVRIFQAEAGSEPL